MGSPSKYREGTVVELPKLREKMPEVEHRIHAYLHQGRTPREPSIRLSSIGKCERYQWALLRRKTSESTLPGFLLAIFDFGSKIEEYVVELLTRSGMTVWGTQETVTVDTGDNMVRGHIDGRVFLDHEKEALLEIKSSNKNRFDKLLKVGYEAWDDAYSGQIQAYMGGLGLERCLAVVYCKDNSKIYSEVVPFDLEKYDSLKRKIDRILLAKWPLPKPEAATSQFCKFCKNCSINEWCWDSSTGVTFDG